MPSSKWNKRPTARRSPSICIAPAGSCLPFYDGRLPYRLAGVARWLDLDPLGPINAAGLITTAPRTIGGLYLGRTTFQYGQLGVIIQDDWPSPTAGVQIWVTDPFWGYQAFNFGTVAMPLDENFDTGQLTSTHIPNYDVRQAWFME